MLIFDVSLRYCQLLIFFSCSHKPLAQQCLSTHGNISINVSQYAAQIDLY